MKIKQLRINRFGHFADRELDFSGGDFHVICGPNEAGKTTLLQFIRDLLFDFPTRTTYDLGGPGEISGVGTLEMRDGGLVELRRRKGIRDKVAIKLDGKPTDFVDADWIRMLDHADRGLFENVFAFGLAELSAGESGLEHESLQSALFGGSLGGAVSPDRVLADLGTQAEKLFKKGGSNPSINKLSAEIKKLKSDIKELALKPEAFREAKQTAESAAAAAHALTTEVDRLRYEHAKVEKRVRAWSDWWKRRQLQQRRDELGTVPNVAPDAGANYRSLGTTLEELREEYEEARTAMERDERTLAALRCDPKTLAIRAEIKSCVELRQSYLEAKQDLPERRRQRQELIREIDRELADLRPGWDHDHLRTFNIDHATRDAIERMNTAHVEREKQRTTLAVRHEKDLADLTRARSDLVELGTARDLTKLEAVLSEEEDFKGDRKQADMLRGELAKTERNIIQQTKQLTPPLPVEAGTPQELPVPRAESIAEIEATYTDLRRRREAGIAAVAEIERDLREKQDALAAAVSDRVVPTRAELEAARQQRDADWELVRRRFVAGESVDSETVGPLPGDDIAALPERYRQLVRQADELADKLYADANEVAKREGLQRQIDTFEQRLKQRRQSLAELDASATQVDREWTALWKPCGLQPLVPQAMRSWLADHAKLCETAVRRDELAAEMAVIEARQSAFVERLLAAFGGGEAESAQLLTQARRTITDEQDREKQRRMLKREIARLEAQQAKYDEEQRDVVSRESKALADWQELLGGLKLPSDWSTELARDIISKLNTTRARLDRLPGEDVRISSMDGRIEEFERRIVVLCSALAPSLTGEPPETAVEKLHDQLEQAIEAQQQSDELSRRLDELRGAQDKRAFRVQRLVGERAALLKAIGAADEAEFFVVVVRAEEARKLDAELDALGRAIDGVRAGEDLAAFEHDLEASELSVLESQAQELQRLLGEAETARNSALKQQALAEAEFRKLDGSAAVAGLSEELARKRSRMADEVDRYIPLVYARRLLTDAVRRFEKENQPEMIATVSAIFARMTAGKYTEFDRTGGRQSLILVRQPDGSEKTPDQLSTGTREQLYLAIRLAYVLDYCRGNQPLPIVIDDVLVNFDPDRARNTLAALADISGTAQVLYFTCHPHMVELAREVVPSLNSIALAPSSMR